MDEQLENRLRFLRKANREGMPHSDRGLFDHLLGTRQLLMEWGSRPAVGGVYAVAHVRGFCTFSYEAANRGISIFFQDH